jgi:hypothetical protein
MFSSQVDCGSLYRPQGGEGMRRNGLRPLYSAVNVEKGTHQAQGER